MPRAKPNPCHSCNSRRVGIHKDEHYGEEGDLLNREIFVQCDACDCGGPGAETRDEAIRLWNEQSEISYER